jgi:cytochrome c
MKGSLIMAGVALAFALPAQAQNLAESGNIRAGRNFAVENCSECHVVVPRRGTQWRRGTPPDFAAIANMPSMTKTALLVFLRSPHPTMPNLILSDRDANDVIAYIVALKTGKHP